MVLSNNTFHIIFTRDNQFNESENKLKTYFTTKNWLDPARNESTQKIDIDNFALISCLISLDQSLNEIFLIKLVYMYLLMLSFHLYGNIEFATYYM